MATSKYTLVMLKRNHRNFIFNYNIGYAILTSESSFPAF